SRPAGSAAAGGALRGGGREHQRRRELARAGAGGGGVSRIDYGASSGSPSAARARSIAATRRADAGFSAGVTGSSSGGSSRTMLAPSGRSRRRGVDNPVTWNRRLPPSPSKTSRTRPSKETTFPQRKRSSSMASMVADRR